MSDLTRRGFIGGAAVIASAAAVPSAAEAQTTKGLPAGHAVGERFGDIRDIKRVVVIMQENRSPEIGAANYGGTNHSWLTQHGAWYGGLMNGWIYAKGGPAETEYVPLPDHNVAPAQEPGVKPCGYSWYSRTPS